ncbi:hypothetical protein ACFLVW_07245, partial [Chloroflexota bacterium]
QSQPCQCKYYETCIQETICIHDIAPAQDNFGVGQSNQLFGNGVDDFGLKVKFVEAGSNGDIGIKDLIGKLVMLVQVK